MLIDAMIYLVCAFGGGAFGLGIVYACLWWTRPISLRGYRGYGKGWYR